LACFPIACFDDESAGFLDGLPVDFLLADVAGVFGRLDMIEGPAEVGRQIGGESAGVGDAWVVLPFAAAGLAADVWVVLFFGGVHSVLPHKSILRQLQDGNDDAEKLSAAE
jgi:hypothetical protein